MKMSFLLNICIIPIVFISCERKSSTANITVLDNDITISEFRIKLKKNQELTDMTVYYDDNMVDFSGIPNAFF